MGDGLKLIKKIEKKEAEQNKAAKPRLTPELLEQIAKAQGVSRRIMSK